MQIEWDVLEIDAMEEIWSEMLTSTDRDIVSAIASRAVELWQAKQAAQGGTMTVDLPDGFDEVMHEMAMRGTKREAQAAVTARGLVTRLASLAQRAEAAEMDRDELLRQRDKYREALEVAEGTRDELRAEAERMKGIIIPGAGWRERAEAAESRLAAIRERARNTEEIRRRFAEAIQSFCTHDAAALVVAMWVWEADGLGDSSNDSMPSNGSGAATNEPPRYPCSPTCTHDDAAKEGHPERVRERSGAFMAVPDVASEVADVLNAEFDKGAEAMRAACWEAVRSIMERDGIRSHEPYFKRIKAAIEGATP